VCALSIRHGLQTRSSEVTNSYELVLIINQNIQVEIGGKAYPQQVWHKQDTTGFKSAE